MSYENLSASAAEEKVRVPYKVFMSYFHVPFC